MSATDSLFTDADLERPKSMTDRQLVDVVLDSLRRWQAYPSIPGSLRWSRNGITALMELEVRLERGK